MRLKLIQIFTTACQRNKILDESTMSFGSTTREHLLSVIPNPKLNIVGIVFFTMFSLLLEVTAASSNICLVFSLEKKSPVRLSHHLMISVCLADLVKSCLYFVIYTMASAFDSWFLGSIMCKILPRIQEGNQVYAIVILTILSRNRYLAISKPLKPAGNGRKIKIYVILFLFYALFLGSNLNDKRKRNDNYFIEDATRSVQNLRLTHDNRSVIAIGYFSAITIVHIIQIYYGVRTARILWRKSKQLGDNDFLKEYAVTRKQ